MKDGLGKGQGALRYGAGADSGARTEVARRDTFPVCCIRDWHEGDELK
ncbi:hypothetical protein SAMN05444166_2427 [Singulisphaera sp. GP187]|nr:hypothetical protein SAMN05444166_2427 [Singulisphaera sp. GP187]